MTNVQDLKISFSELVMLITIICKFMLGISEQKLPEIITIYLNLYEFILEYESISEAVKIFQKCFNFENEKDHEKNRVQVREKLKTNISENDVQTLDEIIESANDLFKKETAWYSKFEIGYTGFYLLNCWNATNQKNESDPTLFSKISKLKRGLKSEQLLFAICAFAAFHLITVNTLILIKTFQI